jgi:hypothetical protein
VSLRNDFGRPMAEDAEKGKLAQEVLGTGEEIEYADPQRTFPVRFNDLADKPGQRSAKSPADWAGTTILQQPRNRTMFDTLWSRRDLLAFAGAAALTTFAGNLRAAPPPIRGGAKRSAYEQAVLESKPVAYWRLGEARGPKAADATGHEHDGKYVGEPKFGQKGAIAGDPNEAIGLDGLRSKSFVEVPDSKSFSVASSGNGLSVEVWMRPDALDFTGDEAKPPLEYIHWLGKGVEQHYEWGFRFYRRKSERPNRISAYIWGPDGKLGAGAYVEDRLTVGIWIYLVATYDDPRRPNAQVRIYKDGEASSHNDSPGTLYKSFAIKPKHGLAPLRLGTRDLRSFLTGGLDEIAIYPRVLGADEIRDHWKVAQEKRR